MDPGIGIDLALESGNNPSGILLSWRFKMKSLLKLILGITAIFTLSVALAGPRVNPKKGKVFFKKYCRVCHDGNSEAAELSPLKKTMDQWSKAFADGGVVKACGMASKEKTGKELTAQDLLDIQAYLVQHAADSDQPATCGN